ncbi:hypothetical protein Q3G72_015646 [Acer saccharum]|nr:hypothetical protein Q3G72_015646 [Acer saccharum]
MTVIKQVYDKIMSIRKAEKLPLVLYISPDVANRLVQESEGIFTFFGQKPSGMKGKDLKEVMGLKVVLASGFAILEVNDEGFKEETPSLSSTQIALLSRGFPCTAMVKTMPSTSTWPMPMKKIGSLGKKRSSSWMRSNQRLATSRTTLPTSAPCSTSPWDIDWEKMSSAL